MTDAPVALLVAGNPSLVASHKEAWARAILKATIDDLPPGSILIHGGEPGPCAWAHQAMAERTTPWRILTYRSNGKAECVERLADGSLFFQPRRWAQGKPSPGQGKRNHYLVHVFKEVTSHNCTGRVLVLLDSTRASSSRYLARVATAAGLPVDRREYAP